MTKKQIELKTLADDVNIEFFHDDPDGDHGRAGDGYYFKIDGQDGWSGVWHSEEEAEREALADLVSQEEKDIVQELQADGYLCVDHDDGRMRFIGKFDDRWFGIVVANDFVRAFETFGHGQNHVFTTVDVEQMDKDDDVPTVGLRHIATRQAHEVIVAVLTPELQTKSSVETSFWAGKNPRQAEFDRLRAKLIPPLGKCDTIEGECLRAFLKIQHDAYNNGGGNNHSGSLMFLKEYLPGFKQEWYDDLREYIVGGEAYESICIRIAEIGEVVVSHVLEVESDLTPNGLGVSVEGFYHEYLGPEGPERRPFKMEDTDEDDGFHM